MMKYTQIPTDAFTHLQMNAGVIAKGFAPATGAVTDIMGATTGGFNFASNPTFTDFGENVDNVPANTKQLKRLTAYDPTISGTFLTVTPDSVKTLLGAASIDASDATHVVPVSELTDEDFADVWVIGDYSDKNKGDTAGFLAVHLMNALNTTGFQLQTAKDEKGQFSFEMHGHYDLTNMDTVPFEIYVKEGTAPAVTP